MYRILQVVIFIVLTMSIVSGSVLYSAEGQAKETERRITEAKVNEIDILASRTELSLNDAASISTITGNIPLLRENLRPELIDPALHGVPEYDETAKREVARITLEKYYQLRSIGLLLPNGDVYLVEPFEAQKNLNTTNLSNNDYYQGVITTGSQYVGDVIFSSASNSNEVPIATPVYDAIGDGSLKGIWVTTLTLSVIDQALSEIESPNTLYIVVDRNGVPIAKSDKGSQFDLENEASLTSFQKAFQGEKGYLVEQVGGIKTFVAYSNVKALSTNWAMLSFQPYEEVFLPVDSIRNLAALTIGITAAISTAFGFFLLRSLLVLQKLSNGLGESNARLLEHEGKLNVVLEDLRNAERGKDEFIAMVSHELKTPLVPIKGYSEMLLQKGLLGDLNDKQRKAALTISRCSDKLETLVHDVLSVYKIDMEKMTFSKADIRISELIERNIHDLQSLTLTADRHIEIKSEIRTSGSVYCDARRIDQVFTNLIKNSINFSPQQGAKILIKAEQGPDSDVIFSIEDNGSGIPANKIELLFKKFYQIDTSTTRRQGGTGLGLVICKGIVEAHGGKIWVDREYSSGACIKFSLPRAQKRRIEVDTQ